MFENLRIALDMGGCPNKCKHCYIGVTKSSKLSIDDLDLVYELFSPYAKRLAVYSWYREPDILNNYQELYEIEKKLSDDEIYERFSLASVYRLSQDENYAKWLKTIGVKAVQLTFFGLESNTNYFTGRPNAYRDLLKAVDILLANKIVPKIQIFLNKKSISDLKKFMDLISHLQIKEKVEQFGEKFVLFAHTGNPTGENLKNIAYRITEKDLKKIPEELFKMSSDYLNTQTPFGIPEHVLYQKHLNNENYLDIKPDNLCFYINHKFDVYPNILSLSPYFKLGNAKKDAIMEIVENYQQNKAFALKAATEVKIKDLVKEFGNHDGIWLFDEDDYLLYLLELYCIKYYQN